MSDIREKSDTNNLLGLCPGERDKQNKKDAGF